MKKFYASKQILTLLFLTAFCLKKAVAQTIASDDARSSAYTDGWTDASNGGTGFGAWALKTGGGNEGFFIGNPQNDGMNTAGIDTTAFGMYATAGTYANARRLFSAPMKVGDELSFYWVLNWDANAGNKGFDLFANDTTKLLNINNAGSSAIIVDIEGTQETALKEYGIEPMLIILTRATANNYELSITSRDGKETTYKKTINNTLGVNGIDIYIGGQNDGSGNRNMYLNKFKIVAKVAELTTTSVSDITSTTATGGGNITNDGGSAITQKGVVWSTTQDPTISLDTKTTDGSGTGSFTSNLTGLTSGTTYYIRAYATNSIGTYYGNEISFTTDVDSVNTSTSLLSYTSALNLYPNPVKRGGMLQMEFNGLAASRYTVSLLNIAGIRLQQVVMIHSGSKSLQSLILSQSLAPGLYFAEISGAGKREVVKLIVQ
jgi:hypothetical protein